MKRRLLAVSLALAVTAAAAAPASAKTTWLCRPGLESNPCTPGFATTVTSPTGQILRVDRNRPRGRPQVDCFYVYPTVSDQPGPQANFEIDPELRSIALYQAAAYSSECRVFAPVYRQITIQGILNPNTVTAEMRETAYLDVRAAWRDYLRRHNRGRGVVLIGHSQGTFHLRELVAREIDRRRAVRRRLVSAVLLGGNVLVKRGRDVGGDFRNVRACRSERQIGCVVAYVTYNAPVPAESRFGRSTTRGTEVLCTNPARLRGGAGNLTPIHPREPFAPGTSIGILTTNIGFSNPPVTTPWLSAPNAYRGRCSRAGGANVLQVESRGGAPRLNPLPDPTWGLHLADASIALGNLVRLVRTQARAYERRR
jgi:pimeloyl-ACP methyl ester carboxylesterase